MSGVVNELLRGRVPPGFDERQARETARILAHKRVDAIAHVRPDVRLLPDWRKRAVSFVFATPNEKCAHWDAEMFAEWVRDHPTEQDADWLALDDVRTGRRWTARVTLGGTTHLVWRTRKRMYARPSLTP